MKLILLLILLSSCTYNKEFKYSNRYLNTKYDTIYDYDNNYDIATIVRAKFNKPKYEENE